MSIQSEINRISGAKETMREYLAGSGVAVPSDASIDEMAALLASVPGGGTGGVELKIVVNVASGAAVTATKGSKTVSGTSVNGSCTLNVPEVGTWAVNGILDGISSATQYVTVVDTYTVSLIFATAVLNDNSWATIGAIATAGQGANYWSVGDRKAITLNGRLSRVRFSDDVVYAFILGFNHNAELEGAGRIHFQLAKTALSGGSDICFVDALYDSSTSMTGIGRFTMTATNKNDGGWESSQMRTAICGGTPYSYREETLMYIIPADLRAALKPVTKYTDNTGGGGGSIEAAVTATLDYFFLLAEYEVFGASDRANSYEASKQAQYSYYSAGNSRVKHKHSATSTAVVWFLRSPRADYDNSFAAVSTRGSATTAYAGASRGFAPAFCV